MAFGLSGQSNLHITGTPAELKPEGGTNTFGHKAKKAKAHYNSRIATGPKISASLKGLKQVAQGPAAGFKQITD